jgi:hypothetical protein
MRYYAKMLVRYLRAMSGSHESAIICIVCRINALDGINRVCYAVRIDNRILVGRLVAKVAGWIVWRRKLIVKDNQVLEMHRHDLDVKPLCVCGERLADVAVDPRFVSEFDGMDLTDLPCEWICLANARSLEFVSPAKCHKYLRFRTFIRSFSSCVNDALLGRP